VKRVGFQPGVKSSGFTDDESGKSTQHVDVMCVERARSELEDWDEVDEVKFSLVGTVKS